MQLGVKTRISDPLERELARRRRARQGALRLSGALMLGVGAVTLAAVLTAPDPDPSDHRPLLICAAVFAARGHDPRRLARPRPTSCCT